jgi:hypothetical protein
MAGRRPQADHGTSDHPARPDVSTGLWASESGIPADPPAAPVTSVFAGHRGWSSNLTPRMNPHMTPRMNHQRKPLFVQMIF